MEREQRLKTNDERCDLLISRLVAGEADEHELIELNQLSASQPEIWYEVVAGARDDVHLMRLMDRAAFIADGVAISPPESGRRAWWRVSGFAGWATAAALALVALVQWQFLPAQTPRPGELGTMQHAAVPTLISARDAFETYLDRGREEGLILSERPRRVLIDARPVSSGDGYEVIYLQQILEKTVVGNLYEVGGQDERGRPVLVEFHEPLRGSM